MIGGLAAGALLGAAISDAHAAPAYGYSYGPAYGYDNPPPRRIRSYEYDAGPVYRTERVVRSYDVESYDGYRPAGYGGRHHCDRAYGYGGW